MTKVLCTFVKCKYNDFGKLGVCQNENIQIGQLVDPKYKGKVFAVCAEYVKQTVKSKSKDL